MLYVTNWQKTQLFFEFCPKKQSKTTFSAYQKHTKAQIFPFSGKILFLCTKFYVTKVQIAPLFT
jgi:hypothetical protein